MDIAKQIVDQRVNRILDENGEKNRSKAFLLLGVAAYLDIDVA